MYDTFKIRVATTGNIVDTETDLEAAIDMVIDYENQDKEAETFIEDWYCITFDSESMDIHSTIQMVEIMEDYPNIKFFYNTKYDKQLKKD